MHRSNALPIGLSLLVLAVGALFAIASSGVLSMLRPSGPGVYGMLVLSVFLIAAGVLFLVKALRGGLEPDGKTHKEVRMDAVERIDSTSLLVKIAKEDPYPEVRRRARERIAEKAAN